MKISRGTSGYKFATGALFLGSIAAFGTEYCVQPIIPVFSETFGLEAATASLAVSFGTGAMAVAMIFIALFAGALPRKIIMATALIVPAALAILIAGCESFSLILLLRFVQGFLLAGFPAMAVAYIHEEFDAKITGAVAGIYIAGSSIGGLLGRILLSSLTDLLDWRTGLEILGVVYVLIGVAFVLTLPTPQHKLTATKAGAGNFSTLLHNTRLMKLYGIIALVCGTFVCAYNFIAFVLLAPPYNLSQTQVGFVYALFLFGSAASAIMGRLADSVGNGRIIFLSLLITLAGVVVSILPSIFAKLGGLALVTYGFFGTHSAAAAWAGKLDSGDKARISAGYMFCFYVGSSVIGSTGGKFLTAFGWNGVVGFLVVVLLIAMLLCIRLLRR